MLRKRLLCLLTALMLMVPMIGAPVQTAHAETLVRSAPLVKAEAPRSGMARIYLSSLGNVTALDLTVAGNYTVDGATTMTLSNGQKVSIAFNTTTGQISMTVNGVTYAMGSSMALRRNQTSGESGLRIAQANRPNNLYPGDLQLLVRTSGSGYRLYPIFHVYIDYYLYGVVPYEMSTSFPIEALKAQAVAARTYTLKRMDARTAYDYDLVDTTGDQVYRGQTSIQNNATKAVDATKGIVITNDGVLTGTYYTASNGGQTESAKNAWSSVGVDYLGVKDDPFDRANPDSNTRELTVYNTFSHEDQSAALSTLLTSAVTSAYGSGISIRTINSITPHTPKYAAPSRLYTKMDFGVTLSTGANATLTLGIFDQMESALGMSLNSGKNELWSVARSGADFVITAGRYGHGIGMSQRGAQQMANMGYTYDQILGFYYDGCQRVQHTFTHTILPAVGSGGGLVVTTAAPATISPGTDSDAYIQLVGVNESIALRYTPSSTGKVLITAPTGSYVNVLSEGSEWTLIRYGEINGYVPTESLVITGTPISSAGASATNITQWGTVSSSSSLNLRDAGSSSGNVIGSIPGHAVVAVFSVSGSWARVQYGQHVGYCNVSYLTLSNTYPGSVASSDSSAMVSLPFSTGTEPLRGTASTTGVVIAQLAHGTQVTVLSNDGTWCRVSVSGLTGYVLSTALDFDATGTTPTTPPLGESEMYAIVASDASTLNLRSGPGTTYDVIAEIPKGTQIVVTSYGSTWCAVRWGSLTGYVMTKYLNFDVEATTAPTASTSPTATPSPTPSATNVPVGSPALLNSNSDLYTAADPESEIQLLIPVGESVSVQEYGETWSKITYSGLTGYVLTANLTLYQDIYTPTASPTASATPTMSPTPVPTFTPVDAVGRIVMNTEILEAPDTSSAVLGNVSAGTIVDVIAIGESWSQIICDGVTGWVITSLVHVTETETTPEPSDAAMPTPDPDAEETFTEELPPVREKWTAWIVATVESVSLCEDDSASSEVLTTIPGAGMITVLDKGDTWCQVQYDGQTGYVMSRYITYTEPMEAIGVRYVNTEVDPLSLRDQPSTAGTIIARMERASQVTLLQEGGDWCYVRYGQYEGYCAARYLSVKKPDQTTRGTTPLLDATLTAVSGWSAVVSIEEGSTLFLREWCAMDAPDIAEVSNGTAVTLLQKGDVWCRISAEGKSGYCLTSKLALTAPTE